ncbi:hypothetical protein [Flavobacterium sp. 2]|uniref:hypothetical protein n=1 Tax=Flavobacterium sp. 2 TaxID=308053 RepID=UPI003CE7A2DE
MIYTLIQLLIISIGATTVMTWFSYTMSKSFKELYKEPVLLAYATEKMKIRPAAHFQKSLGWMLHYLIGLFFVIGYYILWTKNIVPISIIGTLSLGVISGLIGVLSWIIIFRITHHQPQIDFRGYYIQLFFAHVIFAAVASVLFSIIYSFNG